MTELKRKRGRPKGSKNKPKVAPVVVTPVTDTTATPVTTPTHAKAS